ncbi:MAG: 50S ribosomal protein L11 methyltransferase [Pyrinomonadaceae bacterium]|nr:50S ribosomal protein L11 methyltransferase [Pyrinomonadaceae bacterium]
MNNNDKKWFAVKVLATPQAVDAVEFALNESGADGIELDLLGKRDLTVDVTIAGYFADEPKLENVMFWISEGLKIYDSPPDSVKTVLLETVVNQDWLAEWKKHWSPVEAGNFVIAPTWSEINSDKIVIRIEPGMAFGTGTHETTKLCLAAISEKYDGGSFFDVGTGTAILAIAAAKIQSPKSKVQSPKSRVQSPKSRYILACDTDFDSVAIAKENAALNGVGDEIEFYVGSIDSGTPEFDFVVANLTADVIVPILPLLVEKARYTLLLSGILQTQQIWIETELKKIRDSQSWNFEIAAQGEWISIIINKKNKNA